MKGRKPIPTAIKLLNASRKDRINKHEPKPKRGAPKRPKFLDKYARIGWDELAEVLDGMGLLTTADGFAMAGFAMAWARLWRAAEKKDDRAGVSAAKEIRDFSALFGLDPSSRSRIKAPGADGSDDLLAKYA